MAANTSGTGPALAQKGRDCRGLQGAKADTDSSQERLFCSSDSESSKEKRGSSILAHGSARERTSLVQVHGNFTIMRTPPTPPPIIDMAMVTQGNNREEKEGTLLCYDGSCSRVPYGYGVIKCMAHGDEHFFARAHLSREIMSAHLVAGDPMRFRIQDVVNPLKEDNPVAWAYNIRRMVCNGFQIQGHGPTPKYHHRKFASGVVKPVEVLEEVTEPTAAPAAPADPPKKAMRFEPPWSPKLEAWQKQQVATKRKLEEVEHMASQAKAKEKEEAEHMASQARAKEKEEAEHMASQAKAKEKPESMVTSTNNTQTAGPRQSTASSKRPCVEHEQHPPRDRVDQTRRSEEPQITAEKQLPQTDASDAVAAKMDSQVKLGPAKPCEAQETNSSSPVIQQITPGSMQAEGSSGKASKAQVRSAQSKDKEELKKPSTAKSSRAVVSNAGPAPARGSSAEVEKAPLVDPTLQMVVQSLFKDRCNAAMWDHALELFHGTSLMAMLDSEIVQIQRVISEEAQVLSCAAPKVQWHGVVIE